MVNMCFKWHGDQLETWIKWELALELNTWDVFQVLEYFTKLVLIHKKSTLSFTPYLYYLSDVFKWQKMCFETFM